MFADRFDFIHAYYVFCVLNHSGQASELYLKQCRISNYYKPSPMSADRLQNDNQIEIYNALAEKYDCEPYEID